MNRRPRNRPVTPPTPSRRRIRLAITLFVVAALVVVAGLEGSGFILRGGPDSDVRATPDGSSAARLVVVDANGGLSTMDASGGSIVRYPAPGLTFQFPAWSPDGTRIASIATGDGGTHLEVFQPPVAASPATAPTVVYSSPDHPVFYLYWAPDGKALAFLTTEPDGLALRRVAADASGPDTTVRNGAPMYWQWVDPDDACSSTAAATPADGFAGEVGLDGTPAEPSAIEAGSFRAPALSADGTYLASATLGQDGSAQLVVESRDGSVHHEVTVFSLAAFEFDPAGDTLAFTAADQPGGAARHPGRAAPNDRSRQRGHSDAARRVGRVVLLGAGREDDRCASPERAG